MYLGGEIIIQLCGGAVDLADGRTFQQCFIRRWQRRRKLSCVCNLKPFSAQFKIRKRKQE
jgi:hypothetical protein